ncbi:MAG: Stk1 family PASTA domain-containing Ser/Thr kinase [Veillonella sp.]|uniref:Stk1 family PASTA domain-containing Ser/Thr kinase n=1 Tax=Veillonella sp. TaxID=1926307 RepID=UPI001EB22072|nr:Stk1 family PASTA domain-containing Ser/Thr kinase [Veillonella sp.]MBS5270183.1 Stk1 family PASTA domain-containing Ser/Thr kinase [Veillonella sp.]
MKEKATKLQGLILDNRYKIISKIGVGGMADVFKGEDTLLGRPVAVKILHSNFAGDDDFVARFKREAQAAGKLSHPNIVSMYDVGFDQGYHYIVMEYIEGETLKEYITRHERISIDNAVKFTIAIAEGLEHAHAMGIVHCDIKPHNVLITKQGRIKVTDFGIARAMNAGTTMMYTNSIMGSAHYLSPEQASGKPVNGSTDIYSLGAVLYEMLTGRVPYEGETPISVALKHVRERLIPPTRYNPSIPTLLEAAVIKALAKRPEDRFSNITEMIAALRMSQGFVNSNSGRRAPHDFATQVLTPVPETSYGETDDDDEVYYGGEPTQEGWMAKLSRLPQKYILLGAFIVFLLAFVWAFLSFGNFWSNATVDVPNVVGKQVTVAKHILEDNHLRVSVSEVSNPDVPAGQVISQSPEANEQVKEQRTVHLVVSKGVGDITMPDITGMTIDQARSRLKNLGLVIGKISAGTDDSKEDGVILMQSPPGDSKVTKGATVDVTVNRVKSKKVELPNLVGMTVKDAKDALASLGLNATISGAGDDTAVITQQSPEAGSSLDANTSVALTAEAKKAAPAANTSNSNVTKGTVDITVPSGKANQAVRIVVSDDSGSRTVFDGNAQPGERIVKDVSGTGRVQIQVYLNGALVQDQTL